VVPDNAEAVAACVGAAYPHYIERIGKPPRPMLEDYAQVIRRHQVALAEINGAIVGVLVLALKDD
jgi:hypothetical protein